VLFLAPFKHKLHRLHIENLDLFCSLESDTKRRLDGSNDPAAIYTLTAKFLTAKSEYDLNLDEGVYGIGTLFESGVDTNAAAMISFLLAMT
jgi:hypothetical protein